MNARLILAAITLTWATSFAAAEPAVFLVRHGEKAKGGADPKNPALSAAGRARAARLATMLRDAEVTAIFASEFARTQQTAEQIGRATRGDVQVVPAKDTSALVHKLRTVDGNAVVIAHSNTLPEIVKALGVEKPITIADEEYDNLFIWYRSSPRDLVRLRY